MKSLDFIVGLLIFGREKVLDIAILCHFSDK